MRGSAIRSQDSLFVQEQVRAGQVSARGDAPGGFSSDASVMTWVRPGSLCISAMVLPDSRDLMHGRTGGSLRTGSLGNKILGMVEKRKGRRGPRRPALGGTSRRGFRLRAHGLQASQARLPTLLPVLESVEAIVYYAVHFTHTRSCMYDVARYVYFPHNRPEPSCHTWQAVQHTAGLLTG